MKVLLVGGNGTMAARYNQVAKQAGHELEYRERGAVRPNNPSRTAYGCVFVMITTCSHPLRDSAADLARQSGCPIRYLKSDSISAWKAALSALAQTQENARG